MKMVWMAGAAFALMAGAAHAQNHTGLSISVGAANVNGDVTFSGGKPAETLNGTVGLARVGFDYQFGAESGFVVGASYFSTIGDGVQSAPVRDGNYLVQDSRLDGLSGFEGRIGYAFGAWMPYAAYGQTERDLVTRQSCPNQTGSAPFGFCHGGGVPATELARAGQREGDAGSTADTWSVGLEWSASEHVFLDARYSDTDFGTQVVSLDPTGNTPGQLAHPATDPTQSLRSFAVSVGLRF